MKTLPFSAPSCDQQHGKHRRAQSRGLGHCRIPNHSPRPNGETISASGQHSQINDPIWTAM